MDFFTALAPPVVIRIDNKEVTLQRCLLPQMKEWAAKRYQSQIDLATKGLTADEKARFLLNWQPAPYDILDIAAYWRTADGAMEICDWALEKAGVDKSIRNILLVNGSPLQFRELAGKLLSSGLAEKGIKDASESGADPLAGQAGASSAQAGTGATNAPSSATPTPEPASIA